MRQFNRIDELQPKSDVIMPRLLHSIAATLAISLLATPQTAQGALEPWQCSANVMSSAEEMARWERPIAITFPQIGRVNFTARDGDLVEDAWCSVEIEDATSHVVLNTLGGPGRSIGQCSEPYALGRVPSPANVFRVVIIHFTTNPANDFEEGCRFIPLIVYRTLRDPDWRIDETLTSKLMAAGATDTIAKVRNYLRGGKR